MKTVAECFGKCVGLTMVFSTMGPWYIVDIAMLQLALLLHIATTTMPVGGDAHSLLSYNIRWLLCKFDWGEAQEASTLVVYIYKKCCIFKQLLDSQSSSPWKSHTGFMCGPHWWHQGMQVNIITKWKKENIGDCSHIIERKHAAILVFK